MNLEFDYIFIRNFKTYRSNHELVLSDFPVGLHFMRGVNREEPQLGANNCGKTSLFDALSWCLYGKTTSNQKGKEVVPWTGEKETLVEVGITIDKQKHKIERCIGPNYLHLDGKDCSQEHVNSLLHLDYEVFSQTVLLGQGKPLFFDLEPRQKMELFGEVLNLERWDERSKLASEKTKEFEQEHLQLTSDLRSVNISLDGVVKNIDAITEKSKSWADEQQRKLEAALGLRTDSQKQLKKVKDIHDKATLDYESASIQVKLLRTQGEDITKELMKLARDADIVGLKVFQAKRIDLEDALADLDKAKKCPTCRQTIKVTDLDKHKKELKEKIWDLDDKIAPIKKKIAKTQDKFDQLSRLATSQNEHLKKFENLEQEANHQLRISAPDVARLESSIRSFGESIEQYQNETNPYNEQVKNLKRQKVQFEVELKNLDKDLTFAEQQIERHKFWIKGFKDIKLYIIDEVIHELELTTNAMLPDFGLDDWEVKYDIEKETKSGTIQRGLNVTILSPSNKTFVPWASWGGGVGQRLRVISALALSQTLLNYAGVVPDLEVLDEPTAHLSTSGVRDLCDYLSWRAENLGKTIFLVDHKAIESSQFSSVVTVVKDEKGSYFKL